MLVAVNFRFIYVPQVIKCAFWETSISDFFFFLRMDKGKFRNPNTFFFFSLFTAAPVAYGSFWARGSN